MDRRNLTNICKFSPYLCFAFFETDNSFKLQDAQRLADSWGVPYIECSSKTAENVADVFHTLMKEIEKDDGLLAESGEGGCIVM